MTAEIAEVEEEMHYHKFTVETTKLKKVFYCRLAFMGGGGEQSNAMEVEVFGGRQLTWVCLFMDIAAMMTTQRNYNSKKS